MFQRYVDISLGVALATLLLGGATACKDKDEAYPSQSSAQRQSPKGHPKFGWRDALREPPSIARGWLGRLQGCRPWRHLPAMGPDNAGFFRPDDAVCQIPDPPQRPGDRYKITRLLYHEKSPTALVVEPTDAWPFSLAVAEELDLPEFSTVRRRLTEWRGERRHVISLRQEILRGDAEAGNAIAVDIISKTDDRDALDFVRLATMSAWPYSVDHVQIKGPAPIAKEMMLPKTTSTGDLQKGLAIRIGLQTVRMAPLGLYPVRRNGDDADVDPVTATRDVVFGRKQPSGESWEDRVAAVVKQWANHQRDVELNPGPITVSVAPTRTVPFGKLKTIVGSVTDKEAVHLHLIGRRVDALGQELSRYSRPANIALAPGDMKGGSAEPTLRIAITARGLNLTAAGEKIPPVERCPDSGPTLCRTTKDTDVMAQVEKARKMQRREDFEASEEHIEAALAAYDWEALYELAVSFRQKHPEARRIEIKANPGVPFAMIARALEVTRTPLKVGDGDDCIDEFPEKTDFSEAVPCTSEGEPLFDHRTIVGL